MKKVMLVFGTRPEAIKMVALAKALNQSTVLKPVICVTAQHRQMLDQILELFDLVPDEDLNLMKPGQTLSGLSSRILSALEPVLVRHKPDAVLVQGDTTSTLCGALAAFYQSIPVGHVEAGLRTGDLSSPFPEEMNRVLTTRLSRWHFAATEHNVNTLLSERVDPSLIFLTGNPVIDALFEVRDRVAGGHATAETEVFLKQFDRPFILVTGHRRESFGDAFQGICRALRRIAEAHPELDLVYPVHLNPNVQEPVHRILGELHNVHLVEPQAYEPFVGLMAKSLLILTDSGGVQEEAPSLGKPVLVMRDKTERVEALSGGVRLVGTDEKRIFNEAERLLNDPAYYHSLAEATNPYGNGSSAAKIVAILEQELAAGR
jgi:UDP-N-acetylglucosamine 2-epimerase (non-hydrolysing)